MFRANINHNLLETPTKIPPDRDINAMQLTIPTVFLDRKTKAAAKQSNSSKEDECLHKKQDVKESITNILIILRTINIEMQFEQDQKTLLVLSQQREIFDKILIQKQTGQKNSLRTIKNEIISQLQNQIKNLKKSVENKFDLILKTIKTKDQNQSSNQVKTYAQVVASTQQVRENNSQITKQQKQQEKELERAKHREKRLIIQVAKETAENLDSYT